MWFPDAINEVEAARMFVSIALVVLLSSTVGVLIVRTLVPSIAIGANLGLGILVGGSLQSMLALFLAQLELSKYLQVSVPIAALSAVLVILLRSASVRNHLRTTLGDGTLIIRAIGIGTFGLNGYSLPLMAVGILVLLLPWSGLFRVKSVSNQRIQLLTLISVGILSVLSLIRLQPRFLVSDSNDLPFFESLSWTLSHIGMNAHPGFLDGDVWGYHVLAFIWPGSIAMFAGAPPYVVLTLAFPFLASISIALLLLPNSTPNDQGARVQIALVAVLVWILGRGVISSAGFGHWALIAYAVALLQSAWRDAANQEMSLRLRREFLLGIIGVIAILGKGQSLGIVGLLGITPIIHQTLAVPQGKKRVSLRNLPFHLIFVALAAAIWYAPADRTLARRDPSPISNLAEFGLNDGLWNSRDLLEFSPFILLLGLVTAGILARDRAVFERMRPLSLIVAVSLGSTSAVWLLPERTIRTNILQHAFYVSLAAVILASSTFDWSPSVTKRFRLAVAISIPIALLISIYTIYNLNDLLANVPWILRNRWTPEILNNFRLPLLLLVPLGVLVCIRPSMYRSSTPRALFALCISVFTIGVAVITFRTEQISRSLAGTHSQNQSPWSESLPDSDTATIGRWIRKNTPTTSILATNSFCCWDKENWLSLADAQLQDQKAGATAFGEDGFGGSNYLLVSVASRQFLLAGPRFVIPYVSDTATLRRYLKLSGEFGSPEANQALVNLGVDFFIVDKLVPTTNNQGILGLKIFENNRYALFKL